MEIALASCRTSLSWQFRRLWEKPTKEIFQPHFCLVTACMWEALHLLYGPCCVVHASRTCICRWRWCHTGVNYQGGSDNLITTFVLSCWWQWRPFSWQNLTLSGSCNKGQKGLQSVPWLPCSVEQPWVARQWTRQYMMPQHCDFCKCT